MKEKAAPLLPAGPAPGPPRHPPGIRPLPRPGRRDLPPESRLPVHRSERNRRTGSALSAGRGGPNQSDWVDIFAGIHKLKQGTSARSFSGMPLRRSIEFYSGGCSSLSSIVLSRGV